MAASPPLSPAYGPPRPVSAMIRPNRSESRTSSCSKQGGGSRESDDDVKTSVRVAIRIRPPLGPSDPGFDLIPQRFQRSIAHVTSPTSLAVEAPQGRKLFVFDRVFGEDVKQEGMWDYLSDSIDAFVEGYNVSLLAYGQSGSGKSHTMGTSGPREQNDPRRMGIIPRAAAALFAKLAKAPDDRTHTTGGLRAPQRYSMVTPSPTRYQAAERGWTLKATYVEIYNEQLRDLLLPESMAPSERSAVIIREDVRGRILLTGLHQVAINSIDDLLNALNFGSSIRQTDATAINAQSSRSHAIFSLNLVQRKDRSATATTTTTTIAPRDKRRSMPLEAMSGSDGWITIDSKLHFVDLAGSERLKNTGAQGERAREGISINAGLASLGKVISQLSSRHAGSHVSYRDSKLTRILQDSLGGNAVTYMVACVTPAEFHLSETLNTVQYAQRARAIQSKPQIQQVSDDADKQAVIDRLRAEMAFLRERVRNAERGDNRSATAAAATTTTTETSQARAERQHEREVELQNQLLDLQESYSALGQRHARIISEIARAQDPNGQGDVASGGGAEALERLKRSDSFSDAVEQVLLEYEKTIQSLEGSLSQTRSSLSNTEADLLEKESRCAYAETVNHQLESRLQKMLDREASTENYLNELEAKLDGHTSGEEKNAAIVVELRKEIARVRENEASCEDYISTLEERLAEADQDAELMQREIDRLEHVIERQRSLGKLDALMQELDPASSSSPSSLPGTKPSNPRGVPTSTPADADGKDAADRATEPSASRPSTARPRGGDGDDDDDDDDAAAAAAAERRTSRGGTQVAGERPSSLSSSRAEAAPVQQSSGVVDALEPRPDAMQSSAQSDYVAEKLETVTQELIDLRAEHDHTVNEFDMLAAKYEDALRTLGQLQDAVDEARHPANRDVFATPASTRPSSFLGESRANEVKDGAQLSSSRSLSSELFSAGESPSTTTEPSEVETAVPRSSSSSLEVPPPSSASLDASQPLLQELAHLKRLHQEKEQSVSQLEDRYEKLQEQHQDVLDEVEELKTEISKARMNGSANGHTPIIRRKSSQGVMMVDRAHRSFASLRNIASENLEGRPDVLQAFEINLNTALHELYARSERVQELEADIATVKKEMEMKMTIISGLTRERSSLKNSSPMDISVVSTMRDQLLHSEKKMRLLQETQANREKTLVAEIEGLRATLATVKNPVVDDNGAAAAPDKDERLTQQGQKIAELQSELETWERRHQSTVQSMQSSEGRFQATIKEMEAAMQGVKARRPVSPDGAREVGELPDHDDDDDDNDETERSENNVNVTLKRERALHTETLNAMQRKVDEYSASIDSYVNRVAGMERAHADTLRDLHEHKEADLDSHRGRVAELERQLADHEATIRKHEEELKATQASYEGKLEELQKTAQIEVETRLKDQASRQEDAIRSLQAEVTEARTETARLLQDLASVLGEGTAATNVRSQIEALARQKTDAESLSTTAQDDLRRFRAENETMRATIEELTTINESSVKEIERLNEQYQISSRIVEDLEEQLTANFDQHQAANNRFSLLETERNQRVDELVAAKNHALAELEAAKEEMARLESRLQLPQVNGTPDDGGRQRSGSITSNLRKSASVASLPSPPPAIPLPPLPANASAAPNGLASHHSAAPTAAARNAGKEYGAGQPTDDADARLRTIEGALFAEKQLNFALEEALGDLEAQSKKAKDDVQTWKKKALAYGDEIETLKNKQRQNRYSLQAVEEARDAHRKAEAARAQLEERMNAINKKKKKGSLNCF